MKSRTFAGASLNHANIDIRFSYVCNFQTILELCFVFLFISYCPPLLIKDTGLFLF